MAKFNLERLREIATVVKELAIGLRDLNFADNFTGFEVDVTIPAGTESQIRNELTSIPKSVINKGQTGNGLITKGDTEWNINYLYMKNNGASSVTVKLQFLK